MSKKNQDRVVNYDAQSDVLYLGARKGSEEGYIEVAPGIGVELDQNNKVIGVEILNASKVMKPVSKVMFSERAPQRAFAATR